MESERMLEVNPIFRAAMEAHEMWSESLAERLAGGEPLAAIECVPDDVRRGFVSAHDVPAARHVEMQAAFQQHVDGAISKTINLPAGAAVEDVEAVYLLAHRSGCKGVTVYRDGCRPGQPMGWNSAGAVCPRCRADLPRPDCCCRCLRCGYTICS